MTICRGWDEDEDGEMVDDWTGGSRGRRSDFFCFLDDPASPLP